MKGKSLKCSLIPRKFNDPCPNKAGNLRRGSLSFQAMCHDFFRCISLTESTHPCKENGFDENFPLIEQFHPNTSKKSLFFLEDYGLQKLTFNNSPVKKIAKIQRNTTEAPPNNHNNNPCSILTAGLPFKTDAI